MPRLVRRSAVLALPSLIALLAACAGERRAPSADETRDAGDTAPPAAAPDAEPERIPAFIVDDTSGETVAGDTASADTTLRSVYTSLGEDACRLTERDEETGGTTSRCPGAAGYALNVHDWDARMTVDVVAPGGAAHPLRYSGVVTSTFSSLGPRAEWRLRGGRPVALIVRLNAFEDPSAPDRPTSYLVVAKVAGRASCVTARIPPAPGANEAARRAADAAASRPCMPDLAEQRAAGPERGEGGMDRPLSASRSARSR